MKREGPRLFPFFLSRQHGIRAPPFAQVHLRKVVAFALELPPFALNYLRKQLVQSSRLERVRVVCFQ
jgi:hypothetical protein